MEIGGKDSKILKLKNYLKEDVTLKKVGSVYMIGKETLSILIAGLDIIHVKTHSNMIVMDNMKNTIKIIIMLDFLKMFQKLGTLLKEFKNTF